MTIIIEKKATQEEITHMLEEYDSYMKVVVDMEKGILVGGGEYHVDEEQLLLSQGSLQSNLWGGGIDWDTKSIDYNSMINLRPKQGNSSREILDLAVRSNFDKIVRDLLLP